MIKHWRNPLTRSTPPLAIAANSIKITLRNFLIKLMKWLHSMASVIELDKEKVANKQKSKMNIELLSQSSSWTRSRATSSCKNRDSSHSTILSPTYPAHSSRTSACRSRRVQQRQQWWQHRHQELAAGNSNNSSSNNMTLIMNMSTTLLSILSPARRPACCSATTINCHIRTRSYETSCKEYVSPITWILIYLLQFISQQKKNARKSVHCPKRASPRF